MFNCSHSYFQFLFLFLLLLSTTSPNLNNQAGELPASFTITLLELQNIFPGQLSHAAAFPAWAVFAGQLSRRVSASLSISFGFYRRNPYYPNCHNFLVFLFRIKMKIIA